MTREAHSAPMALLLAGDSWPKLEIFTSFLQRNGRAVWRTGDRRNRSLWEINFPINLYFFHRNTVRYRARCIDIVQGSDWLLSDIPSEYRGDRKPYCLYYVFDRMERIADTPISAFPKWSKPEEVFERGLLGLQKVRDILPPT